MSAYGNRANPLITTGIFGAALFVYVRTLCPTVYWEDAGELITVSRVLGIAHPPGHPLYTILGHLFALIPVGTIAARVNFMSAFFGALASTLVYPVFLRLIPGRSDGKLTAHCAGAAAALFAAFGLTLWDQSVVAETSTLHAFFFMTLLLLFVGAIPIESVPQSTDGGESSKLHSPFLSERGKRRFLSRRLILFSFVYGLSLTNHVAGVFLIPAFAVWALVSEWRRVLSPRSIALSLLFFSLGLSIYLYLPIRSAQNPLIDWGNPETLSNFWWVVSAGQFQSNVFSMPGFPQLFEITARHIRDICENFQGVGIFFILVGIWSVLQQRKDFLLFASVAIMTLFAVTMNPAFITAYFIPGLLLLTIFLAFGAEALAGAVVASARGPRRIIRAMVCVALLLSPIAPLVRHYPMNDRSHYFFARDYGMRILDELPRDAAFFTIDLNAIFTIWYLKYCEGMRPDVLVIEPTWLTNSSSMQQELLERYPQLLMPESGEKVSADEPLAATSLYDRNLLLAILRKNVAVRPIFWGAVPLLPSLEPRGLVYEFPRQQSRRLDDETIRRYKEFWENIADEFQRIPELTCDRVASLIYPENLNQQGNFFKEAGYNKLAQWAFELAIKINPTYAPAWLQLGELSESNGDYRGALSYLEQAASIDSRVRPRAHFVRGQIFYKLGENQLALNAFTKVVTCGPDFPDVHNMLGVLYLRINKLDSAVEEFREEIRVNPATADAYSNLAQITIQKSELGEAERILRRGIVANANAWQNYYFLAYVHALRNEHEEACKLLQTAAGMDRVQVMKMAENDPILAGIDLR